MNIEIQPYFAEGERYPALIGVRVEGDEYQMAYVSKVELADALAENAKLRKLCAGLLTGYDCGYGELCKGCTWDGLGDSKTFSCLPRVQARELGVEVGDG